MDDSVAKADGKPGRFRRWVRSLPLPVYIPLFLLTMFVVLTTLDAIFPGGNGISWRDNIVTSVALGSGLLGAEALLALRYGRDPFRSDEPWPWKAQLLHAVAILAIALTLYFVADLLGLSS